MSGMSERRRRKMMREMRLAGYELPETPYKRVNRSYRRKGKTGVSTKRVTTSKKVVTGKRLAYVRMFRYMSNDQRKAMFAKMQQNGTYDPTPFLNGRKPTKEERKWIRWIAGGKVGPSPYDKEHARSGDMEIARQKKAGTYNIIDDPKFKGSYYDPDTWKTQTMLSPNGKVNRYQTMKQATING